MRKAKNTITTTIITTIMTMITIITMTMHTAIPSMAITTNSIITTIAKEAQAFLFQA